MIAIYILAGIGGLMMLGLVLLVVWGVASAITGGLPSDQSRMDYTDRELDSLGERVTRLHREVIASDERGTGNRQ